MNDIIAVLCILLGIPLVVALIMIRENASQRKRLLYRIQKEWAVPPQREYTYEEFESISHFSRNEQTKEFKVDDITWNDLDMDRIFMLINNTMSSCGEEYLYDMLRKPEFSQETLDKRNRLIEFFRTHEEERVQIQLLLGRVGKTSKASLWDYINCLKKVEKRVTTTDTILAVLGILSVFSIFLVPSVGVIWLVTMIGINFVTYFKGKGEIAIYLKSFQCILRMLKAADEFEKINIDELQVYSDAIKEARLNLAGFRRGSSLVTSSGSTSGDPLEIVFDYVKMFLHIDLIKFNGMLLAVKEHEKDIDVLIRNLGTLDSAISIASYRTYLPYYCRGTFRTQKDAFLNVENLYHPLIEQPVANSITVSGGTLVTGSNASGKSTFLKNIAINSILAQTIDTCVAQRYEASFLKVMTSMALRDDLESGESYYIVEIKSLKRILEEAKVGIPMLCIVDEVLRGTNTIERIAASSRILKELNQKHVLSFAATHDIELSYILEKEYDNYHFTEEIKDNQISFNYLLKKGRATSRNAIKLLEMLGYEKKIVESAQNAAIHFEKYGVWE